MFKRLKTLFKYAVLTLLLVATIFYAILAVYIWWSDRTYRTDRPLQKSIHDRVKKAHGFTLIEDGLTSLVQRLRLIKGAQKNLELEFFIYDLDFASKILTFQLIEQAKKGVKIRLLVDFAGPVFKLAPVYALFMQQNGIEVRYYNTSPAYSFIDMQHRNHRKLLVADGVRAITGGRNIANDYFNMSPHYNFLDADVLVEGPIVKTIGSSFELYWKSEHTTAPPQGATNTAEVSRAMKFFSRDQKLNETLALLARGEKEKQYELEKQTCSDVEFVTDLPGVTHENRRVFQVLSRILAGARKSVLGETPYFIIRPSGLKLIKQLDANKVKTTILTNSLYATDAWYTVAALQATLGDLSETGINIWAYNGTPPERVRSLDGKPLSKRWGVHAKRAVIDEKKTIIGTYNVDPRSANLNSELLVICHDGKEVAKRMSDSIGARLKRSYAIVSAGKADYDGLFEKADFSGTVMAYLARPLIWLFEFLL